MNKPLVEHRMLSIGVSYMNVTLEELLRELHIYEVTRIAILSYLNYPYTFDAEKICDMLYVTSASATVYKHVKGRINIRVLAPSSLRRKQLSEELRILKPLEHYVKGTLHYHFKEAHVRSAVELFEWISLQEGKYVLREDSLNVMKLLEQSSDNEFSYIVRMLRILSKNYYLSRTPTSLSLFMQSLNVSSDNLLNIIVKLWLLYPDAVSVLVREGSKEYRINNMLCAVVYRTSKLTECVDIARKILAELVKSTSNMYMSLEVPVVYTPLYVVYDTLTQALRELGIEHRVCSVDLRDGFVNVKFEYGNKVYCMSVAINNINLSCSMASVTDKTQIVYLLIDTTGNIVKPGMYNLARNIVVTSLCISSMDKVLGGGPLEDNIVKDLKNELSDKLYSLLTFILRTT